jgi:formylglycine-generating enzyme
MNVFQGRFLSHDTGDDGRVETCPVGTYPPGDVGLFEMTGNVWEWRTDWFDPTYYRRSPRVAPTGPASGGRASCEGLVYLCHEATAGAIASTPAAATP